MGKHGGIYLYCEKRKQKMKVDIEVCINAMCPHVKQICADWICNYKSKDQKRIEKRKK